MNIQKMIEIQLHINEYTRKISDTYVRMEVLCDSGIIPDLESKLNDELDTYYSLSTNLEKQLPVQMVYTPFQIRVLQDLNKKREALLRRELIAEHVESDFAISDKLAYEILRLTLEIEKMDTGFVKLFFSKL